MQMQRLRKVLHLPPMKPSLRHTVAQFSLFVHIPTNRSLSFSHSLACTAGAISISSSTTYKCTHSRPRVSYQDVYITKNCTESILNLRSVLMEHLQRRSGGHKPTTMAGCTCREMWSYQAFMNALNFEVVWFVI